MNFEVRIRLIDRVCGEKWDKFQTSELHSFSEFVDSEGKPLKNILKHSGVYIVYEDDEPVYVGSAGKGKTLSKI